MKRLLAALFSVISLLSLAGCGNVFVDARWNGGGTAQDTSGLVVIVELSNVSNNGTFVLVTLVTIQENGTSTILPFCGDQRSQFPLTRS